MRRAVTALLRVLIRTFFKRIEIVDMERVPADVPVIFAVNHPNALIDPLFLLCFAPRPVSFLAKAPLFTMPVIGWFVRGLDSIPVYRKQDNVAGGSNDETFARARSVRISTESRPSRFLRRRFCSRNSVCSPSPGLTRWRFVSSRSARSSSLLT